MTARSRWIAALAVCACLMPMRLPAAEICGISDGFFKSSFESGELPGVTLPPSNTPVSLTATSPADNTTVGTDTIQVRGNWTGPANTGITVNGILVVADFTSYASLSVVLQPGMNNVPVVLTTQDGVTQSITLHVTYNALLAGDVSVLTDNTGDLAPLTSIFTVSAKTGLTASIVRIQADFDGNGTTDTDTTNLATVLKYTYLDPGTYDARFIVSLSDLTTRTVFQRVIALNANQTRDTLCQVYGDMRTRLSAPTPDISGALNTLHPEIRNTFQVFWGSLSSSALASAASQLGNITDGTFSTKAADLLMTRPSSLHPGEYDAFHFEFERDDSGVWRISDM